MSSGSVYIPELVAEKDSLDPSFVQAMRLLGAEISRLQNGGDDKKDDDKKYRNIIGEQNFKLAEKVLIPAKQHPKFNFVGKLLGPQGNTLKRLQVETGTRMAIMGKGCMKDRAKEEELRNSGEAKYVHLNEELHVLIEVYAPLPEAYSRMGHALEEVKKFFNPDYNDEICQEQLMEMTYLNGVEVPVVARGRAMRGRGIPPPPPGAPALIRGRGVGPPLLRGPQGGSRGVASPRGVPRGRGGPGGPVERGGMSARRPIGRGAARGASRGAPTTQRARLYTPRQQHGQESYQDCAYDDSYSSSPYESHGYETYDYSSLPTGVESYDYGHGSTAEAYTGYGQEEKSGGSNNRLKTSSSRAMRYSYREHPYGRY
uniref:KH domain containing, RNA binding, signal transduction associated 1a n=1 Tax=Petromyzon marinus TaxID=7757 RepID=S4RIJ1_PETMA